VPPEAEAVKVTSKGATPELGEAEAVTFKSGATSTEAVALLSPSLEAVTVSVPVCWLLLAVKVAVASPAEVVRVVGSNVPKVPSERVRLTV